MSRRTVQLMVNGAAREILIDEGTMLLDALREDLGLTGAKRGCGKGECGACTVLVDELPIMSCIYPAAKAEGRSIVTIEGLGNGEKLHALQKQFIEKGAVQCGFCTPGLILSSKALLDGNPNADEQEIRTAISGNLCRCTGYTKVVEAVKAAGEELRGQTPGPGRQESKTGSIGRSFIKMDCFPKVTGKALYTNDISFPGMLFAGILRSPYPSARLLSIDCAEARRCAGVRLVLTAEDIPGNNKYGGVVKDQQHLCDEKVRYVGDPVAVVVGGTQEIVRQALKEIRVNYRELPAVFDPEEAMAAGAPLVHDDGNILHHRRIRKGDAEAGFAESDIIIEKSFHSQTMEHAYIEPEAGLAYMDNGQMVLYCCTQAPHYFRSEIASMLGLSVNRVRVIRAVTGGGFGGKGELFGQQYAALSAYVTGLPVKCVLTREESIIVTPKRHAFTLYYRFGATKDGRLRSARVTIIGNGGAYASLGPAVLTRSATMAIGPYDCPNVSVDAYEVYTNYPIGGAMRGFGAPQMAPCHEAIMDEIGRKCGLSPVEIRRRNMLRPGSSTVTGQVLEYGVGALATLEEASRRGWPSSRESEK